MLLSSLSFWGFLWPSNQTLSMTLSSCCHRHIHQIHYFHIVFHDADDNITFYSYIRLSFILVLFHFVFSCLWFLPVSSFEYLAEQPVGLWCFWRFHCRASSSVFYVWAYLCICTYIGLPWLCIYLYFVPICICIFLYF